MDSTYKFADKPAMGLKDVTPGAADLTNGVCRGLLVTIAGNLEITTSDGSTPTAFPVVVGQTINVQVLKVTAGTTATVKAIY